MVLHRKNFPCVDFKMLNPVLQAKKSTYIYLMEISYFYETEKYSL